MELQSLLDQLPEDSPMRPIVKAVWERIDAVEQRVETLVDSHE